MKILAETIFWTCAVLVVYTYAGYPLLVWLAARVKNLPVAKRDFEPTFSVIIAAYNEEKDIAQKLENTLALDYPSEKLEIIVASDGSTDATDEIVRTFETKGVRLFRQEGRLGKTSAQNTAVTLAKGEIILFSDATTMYRKNVLRVIAPNFADEKIGCAAGKLIYVDPKRTNVGKGAKSYWNYETFLKENESRACSLIGVSGCLYAVRRAAYVPMYPEACSDFLIATKMFEQGLRTVYEPLAVCTEETNDRAQKELRMRVRVITQTLTDLWRHRHLLNPLRAGFYAVELFSHKLLRYAIPFFLILIFASNLILSFYTTFYAFVFALQILFYLTACVSFVFEQFNVNIKILALPKYFVLANLASFLAFVQFLRGERYARWEPIRSQSES